MRRTWLVLPLIALVVTGCGVRPSAVILGAPAPEGPANAIPGAPSPSGPTNGVVLYFLSGGEPVRVLRPFLDDLAPAGTIGLLAAGPDENERRQGYTSEVPAGTTVLDQTVGPDGVAVTLSVGVAGLSARAVDQLVCTTRDSLGSSARITLRGGGGERGPLSCPLVG